MRFLRNGLGCIALMILVSMVAVSVPGFASAPLAARQRVVHAASAGDIGSLDPALPWVSVESPIVTVVMEGLVDYPLGEVSTNFQPALAESWEVSEDGTVYTFYLRKGVQWHEGFGEFTAEDVKFTLDRYRDPDASSWASEYANVESVDVIDRYTVRVVLAGPDPFFLGKLATNTMNVGLMLSKRAFEERGAERMRLHPIGTGPFRFKEYRPKDQVVLVRNDDYWGGKAILEEVTIKFMPSSTSRELALRTGEIDSMRVSLDARLIDRLVRQGYIVDAFGPEIHWWLHINTSVEPLNDVRVRQAIAFAINREELRGFFGPEVSDVSDSLLTQTYFGAATRDELPEEARWEYNPEKARQLLAEAGYPNGFKLSMIITQRDDYRQLMTIMQEHLRRVGIDLELNLVDHTHYHSQIINGVNPLVLFGDLSYPNSEILLQRFFHSNATRNFANWHNPEFDAILERVSVSPSLEERREWLVKAQQLVARDFIVVPTVVTKQPLVRHPRVDLGYELRSSLALNYRFWTNSRILQK